MQTFRGLGLGGRSLRLILENKHVVFHFLIKIKNEIGTQKSFGQNL